MAKAWKPPPVPPHPRTIQRMAREVRPDRIRKTYVVVRSVVRQGVVGDLVRHVVVVDADGHLDPEEVQLAMRAHFADPRLPRVAGLGDRERPIGSFADDD